MNQKENFTCQKVLSITVFLGFVIHHMLRANISIAIVEMVGTNSTNTSSNPRYNWSETEKNDILGYFFWGYILTQVPSALISEKFGFKIIIGTGLLCSSLSTLFVPLAAQRGLWWLIFLRFLLGMSLGVHWSPTHAIAAKWIQPCDTAKFLSHMIASSLGVAVTLPVCGYMLAYFGWPSVFYVTGTLALIWSFSWFYLIYDSPEEHPRISNSEKEKLRKEIQVVQQTKKSVPWKKILQSGPVWSIIIGNTFVCSTFFFVLNELPTYLSQILCYNIKENGWLSSCPHLGRYFVSVTSAILSDKLMNKSTYSKTTIRKIFLVFLFFGSAILFTMQAFFGYSRPVSLIVFNCSMCLVGFATPSIISNPVDLAPQYAATIFGITQIPVGIIGYLTTKIVANATKEIQDFEHWSYVFWILVMTNVAAGSFCLKFTSGKRQEWSLDKAELEKINTFTIS